MSSLYLWAQRWGIPAAAVADLEAELGVVDLGAPAGADTSEGAAQVQVRLEASARGCRLFRNNVGALYDEHGNFIRFGLANDSQQLNQKVKSADLIGIRPVVITQAHVGATIGQFLSREIKAPGWRYRATEREKAQLKWAELVLSLGGDAAFATGAGTI